MSTKNVKYLIESEPWKSVSLAPPSGKMGIGCPDEKMYRFGSVERRLDAFILNARYEAENSNG